MKKEKDFVKMIAAFLAKGDFAQVKRIAVTSLNEIGGQIESLERQVDLIRKLAMYARQQEPERKPANKREEKPKQPTNLNPIDRSRVIREIAVALANQGNKHITIVDVMKVLKAKGLELGVKRPPAVIGTVIAAIPGLKKTGTGKWEVSTIPKENSGEATLH
ncbi:MAG TPA: hypothetical protein VGL70_12780 [Candidatus Binatia bacterium]|jgi:hypothetical protein